MQLKFCGLTQPEDLKLAVQLGADAVGFIFYSKSPRFISPAAAAALLRQMDLKQTAPVGVFVDHSLAEIIQLVRQLRLAVVQLHSERAEFQSEATLTTLRQAGVAVWRVLRLTEDCTPETVVKIHFPTADAVLLDTRVKDTKPKQIAHCRSAVPPSQVYGGTGKALNPALVQQLSAQAAAEGVKLVVAGGLEEQRIKRLLRFPTLPHGIDVNSGVEDAPGIKNHSKMQAVAKLIKTRKGHRV